MFNRRRFIAAAATLPLTACKVRTINYFPVGPATVRYINLLPVTGNLDVVADSGLIWGNIAFEQSADYVQFEAGQTKFAINNAGTANQLTTTSAPLAGQQPYTLLTYGSLNSLSANILGDTTLSIPTGNTQFRIFHCAFGIGNIDIYVTKPDTTLVGFSPFFTAQPYSSGTIFTQIPTGEYRVRITVSQTAIIIYDSGRQVFADTIATDLLFYSRNSAALGNMAYLQANGPQQRGFVDNRLARYKVINAAFQTGIVNQFLDGEAKVSDLPVGAASAYRLPEAGSHVISFQAKDVPGATIASTTQTLAAATDSSVFVAGFAGSTQAVVLADDNHPPGSGNGRFRIVNACPDGPPLDVFFNDTRLVTGLAYTKASAYVELGANGVTLRFVNPASGTTVLTIPNVQLQSGFVLSVYAIGPIASLGSLVTQDNIAQTIYE
jgi:hypothetical protein